MVLILGKGRVISKGIFIGGLLLTSAHIYNKLISHLHSKDKLLSTSGTHYYDWKFGSVFYTKRGKGPPILLIHDLDVSSSSYEWNRLIRSLAHTNTVYTLDLLGCGRSDRPALAYTDYLYVQLVTDFIKKVIGEPVDVVSTGFSSTFTIAACNNDNTIIKRIVLISPKSIEIPLQVLPCSHMLRPALYLPIIGTFVYNHFAGKSVISERFATDYFKDISRIRAIDIDTYTENAHTNKGRAKFLFASIQAGLTSSNIKHGLKILNRPLFIIMGEDAPHTKATTIFYQKNHPIAEIIKLSSCKHLPQLEHPKKVFEELQVLLG